MKKLNKKQTNKQTKQNKTKQNKKTRYDFVKDDHVHFIKDIT